MTIKKDDGNWHKPFKHSLVNGIKKKRIWDKTWEKIVLVVDTIYNRKVVILYCPRLYSFVYSIF